MAASHERHVEIGSERGFGIVFAVVFLVVALWPLIGGAAPRWWAVAVAAALLVVAFVYPRILAGPNRLWFRFGLLLGRIVAPVVMAIIFVVTVIPTGVIMRLLGKDLLQVRRRPASATYWHDVNGEKSSMKNQF